MQGGEQGTPVMSLLIAAPGLPGDPPQQGYEDQKPLQWFHKLHSLAEQGAAGAWLTSAVSYRAEDPQDDSDGQWDSQHDPAVMSHGASLPGLFSSPAWKGENSTGAMMDACSQPHCLCNALGSASSP